MKHEEQVRLLRRGLGHTEAGTTDQGRASLSPVSRYLSPERVAREPT